MPALPSTASLGFLNINLIISRKLQEGNDELVFKQVRAGDSIASFLSCLVVLTNRESSFKSVAAKAVEDSKVLRLRYKEFSDLIKRHPDSMVRLVQVVMIRLQRVNFTALHDYLGLTTQMMRTRDRNKSMIHNKGSPMKVTTAFPRRVSNEDRDRLCLLNR